MGYTNSESMVRMDFFKATGKWYMTEAVDMVGMYEHGDGPYGAVKEALKIHNTKRGSPISKEFFVVCLEPYHKMAFPVILRPRDY